MTPAKGGRQRVEMDATASHCRAGCVSELMVSMEGSCRAQTACLKSCAGSEMSLGLSLCRTARDFAAGNDRVLSLGLMTVFYVAEQQALS